MEVLRDLFEEGGGVTLTRRDGKLSGKEVIFVKDVPGSTLTEKIYAAMNASGVPQEGGIVSGLPGRVICKEVSGAIWPPQDVVLTCTYETDDGKSATTDPGSGGAEPQPGGGGGGGIIIEGGSQLDVVETEKDSKGVPFVVGYTPPGGKKQADQGGRVRQFRPKDTYMMSRTLKTTITAIRELRKAVSGKVNGAEYLGYRALELLCGPIRFKSLDGLKMSTFEVSVEIFTDTYDSWIQFLRWINPETNLPAPLTAADIKSENGIKGYLGQGQADFGLIDKFFTSK